VRRALELGVTLFDTAELYGNRAQRQIHGEVLGEDRESVFLATKIVTACRSCRPAGRRAACGSRREPGSWSAD